MENLFLSMQGINKRYAGVQALENVDFAVRQGEILCLAGTNGSGKSTLVKIISGVVQPEPGGEIVINGNRVHHLSSMESIRNGIEVIYQDLSLFPNLTVQENISISETVSSKKQLISWKKSRETAEKAMERIGIHLDPDAVVSGLSMADQQLVAISRALTGNLKLLIMDEPTTALTKKEIDALLAVVIDMKAKGIATLFISHKLNEVMEVAERVTVLRDGKSIGCFSSSELDDKKIEYHMTGTTTTYSPYHAVPDTGQVPLLQTRELSKKDNFSGINLTVHPGEIVGITGLLGSGRTELALSLFGLNPPDSGEILLSGKPTVIDSVKQAMHHGIAYVPENRLVEGLILDQSIGKNIVITVLDRLLTGLRFIDNDKVNSRITQSVKELSIKIPGPEAAVKTLSGGNQQRVVLAKWIASNPGLCILDNPTVGIDIAAKSSIHAVIKQLALNGMGIIIISDEIPEVLYNCNRVLIMNRGRIIREFVSLDTTEEEIQAFIEATAV